MFMTFNQIKCKRQTIYRNYCEHFLYFNSYKTNMLEQHLFGFLYF